MWVLLIWWGNMHKNYTELINEIISSMGESSSDMVQSERHKLSNDIQCETYNITTDEQVQKYHREKGRYTLLSIPDILYASKCVIDDIVRHLKTIIKSYVGRLSDKSKILVVGLGNRHISSDSLGTKVVSKINVTVTQSNGIRLMAMCPSVMGLTGIETYDIVSGVIEKVKPTHLIIIDCLCAGAVDRLGKSIQLSNTGLCPGSGIGNKRKCIGIGLAKNILSIGVPLLIYANTFLDSACADAGLSFSEISTIMQKVRKSKNLRDFYCFAEHVKKLYNIDFEDLIVSPKDVDECVNILSDIISTSINEVVGLTE